MMHASYDRSVSIPALVLRFAAWLIGCNLLLIVVISLVEVFLGPLGGSVFIGMWLSPWVAGLMTGGFWQKRRQGAPTSATAWQLAGLCALLLGCVQILLFIVFGDVAAVGVGPFAVSLFITITVQFLAARLGLGWSIKRARAMARRAA